MTRLGLLTPVVSLLPRAHNDWERHAGAGEVAAVAGAADDAGFWHLTCSDHTVVPPGAVGAAGSRGTRYWEPFTTLGFLAAHTHRIRLSTFVLPLPLHHPLTVLKRLATLDAVSDGRAVLGVGVGSLREEFTALAADWDARGDVTDDALVAIVSGLAEPHPVDPSRRWGYHGTAMMDPTPGAATAVPIWVGGRTLRSLRRAATFGQGWAPFALDAGQIGSHLDAARAGDLGPSVAEVIDGVDFDVIVWAEGADDPIGDPNRFDDIVGEIVAAGATVVNLRVASRDVEHHCDQLRAAAERVTREGV